MNGLPECLTAIELVREDTTTVEPAAFLPMCGPYQLPRWTTSSKGRRLGLRIGASGRSAG